MFTFQSKNPAGDALITWEITLSVSLIRRIKGLLKIDLMTPDTPPDRPPVLIMGQDLVMFVDVLYACCQKQAESLQLNDELFVELLEDAVFVAARQAFWAEWEDFFERAGATAQAAILKKQREIFQLAAPRIANIPAEHFMTEVDERIASLIAGPTSTKSPAFSGSTPNR